MTTTLSFTKGHGTQNDFVLVPDLQGAHDLTPAEVVFLADRRAGIGADGVIRVVATSASDDPLVAAQAGSAAWFMDYRNADGSVAEMCGNGTRVFAAYLAREGLEIRDSFAIATRAGVKQVRREGSGYGVGLGHWRLVRPEVMAERGFDALVRIPGADPLPGLSLDLGNPHTVVALPPDLSLTGLDLTRAPELDPPPSNGSNVEFVHLVGQGHLQMRVVERGVGETRSCGTGAAAAAVAAMLWSGDPGEHRIWRVDVPGGTLQVTVHDDQSVDLAGPAVLVADGTVTVP